MGSWGRPHGSIDSDRSFLCLRSRLVLFFAMAPHEQKMIADTISVVIPMYNECESILHVLNDLKNRGDQVEIIVVDGGSSDESMSMACKLARVETSRKGRAVQMNAGAETASGDILLFLHADTVLPEGALAKVKECLKDPDVIGGRFKVSLTGQAYGYRLVSWMINLRDGLTKGFTGDQAIFIKRESFFAIGRYKEMQLFEDLDLARRMKRSGKVVRIPDNVVTSSRRWEKGGLLKTITKMWILRTLYLVGVPDRILSRGYDDVR